jgi:Family of unknown function (DUF5690)
VKDIRIERDVSDSRGQALVLTAWSVTAAFGAYFCMYAFRKPFTAGTYAELSVGGIGYKTILVTSQTLGYTLSKFIGIKVVSEVEPQRRLARLLTLIGGAEATLFLFGLTPAPFNFVWLFCNGLFLGMVFGLVLGFLEGRKQTEALAAGLCTSFIVADGVTKSAGGFLLKAGVSEYWMPFWAGLLFVPPLLLFAWMLRCIPRPSREDVAARSARVPMNGVERWSFFRRYAAGLVLLVLMYLLITILRSVRADFAPEIWAGLKVRISPDIFAWSEIAVAIGVVALNGSAVLINGNRRAFFFALALSISGVLLVAMALVGLRAQAVSPFTFMVLHGLGLYLPYIAVQTTIFERLIAMTRDRGNIGYLIYLADSFGYLGYVAVLFARSRWGPPEDFLGFFITLSWVIVVASLVLLIPCWHYFAIHPATRRTPALPTTMQVERV